VSDASRKCASANFSEQMLAVESLAYSPHKTLVKVNLATMSVSLQTRALFFEERIIEFAWRLPARLKIQVKKRKLILRQLLHHYVPVAFVGRSSQGFGVPVGYWLRGLLREGAENLPSPKLLSADRLLDAQAIRIMWVRYLSGRIRQYAFWPGLMYQAWKRNWCESEPCRRRL
jgi:asparagine synthase (glutamine-hydrolysing)